MKAKRETPQGASSLVGVLWQQLARPSIEVDPGKVAYWFREAFEVLAPSANRFRAVFAAKSRRKSPVLFDAPMSEWEGDLNGFLAVEGFGPLPRPHLQALSWHELPLAVAAFCFPAPVARDDWLEVAWDGVCSGSLDHPGYLEVERFPMPEELPDWRKQLAAIVAKFPRALHNIEAELRAATAKPRGSVADALVYLSKNPNATDTEAAEAAGVTTRALRASKRWDAAKKLRDNAKLEARERFKHGEESALTSGLRIYKKRPK